MSLELVSTDELIAELLNRCDHGAIGLMRVEEHGTESHSYYRKWKGNSHTCIGLLRDVEVTILEALHENSTPIDDEDEV